MPRIAGHHFSGAASALFLAEALVVILASRVGWALGPAAAAPRITLTLAVACALMVQLAFYWVDLYDLRVAANDWRRGRRLLSGLGGAFALAIPATLMVPAAARAGIPFALAAAGLGAAALRAAAPWQPLRRRVVVLGNGNALRQLLEEVADGPDIIADVIRLEAWSDNDLLARVRAGSATRVVTAFAEQRGVPSDALLRCRLAGIEIVDAASHLEETCRRIPVDLLRPGALVYGDGFSRSRLRDAARRALSFNLAFLLGTALLPLALLIALVIRLTSPGPVLFRQTRVGRGGRNFIMLKFRTMRSDAEEGTGAVWAQESDPRVTRIGTLLRQFRLDEVPQLLNVLAGDMDLVGPRPERPEFVDKLARALPYYDLRALVRPGLTGWAQIRYRYGASLEDARHKLAYDLYYVKHAGVFLDAVVLVHTAKVVLGGRGAR